jgi:transposase InsO family protein
LRSIEPGKPAQNAAVEGFNGRLRDEGPNQHRFPGLGDVQRTIGSRRRDDDRSRPHGALAYRPSEEFRLAHEAGAITRRQRVGLS